MTEAKLPKLPEVDADVKQHMLRTYAGLRLLMAVVTLVFLATLTLYRSFGTDTEVRNSISAYYYHTNADLRMRDLFVGTLAAVGLLLIAYQGYTDRENAALNIGGAALLFVVFFPMDWPPASDDTPVDQRPGLSTRAYIHYAGAFIFFGALAYVSLYRAHDTLAALPDATRRAAYKNTYRLTGTCMLLVPVAAIVLHYGFRLASTVYWVEFAGVAAFLWYWMVKSSEMSFSKVETPAKMNELTREVGNGSNTRDP